MPTTVPSLIDLPSRFISWWGRELSALVPKRDGSHLRGRRIVLKQEQAVIRLGLEDGRREIELARSDDLARSREVDGSLERLASQRSRPPIVIRLSRSSALERTVLLPEAAVDDAHNIAMLDLERATPLRTGSVLAACEVQPGAAPAGRVRIRQYVVKRADIAPSVSLLQRHGLAVDRIEIETGEGGPPIALRSADSQDSVPTRRRSWTAPLLLLTVAGVAAAAAIAIVRYERAVASVRAQNEQLRAQFAQASAARATSDATGRRLDSLIGWHGSYKSRAVVVDTLTRLLPDTDYLTSLQIADGIVELSGYSVSTAVLVPIIERSGVFDRAMLTSPAVLDQRTGKERFTLRARIVGEGRTGSANGGQGG